MYDSVMRLAENDLDAGLHLFGAFFMTPYFYK